MVSSPTSNDAEVESTQAPSIKQSLQKILSSIDALAWQLENVQDNQNFFKLYYPVPNSIPQIMPFSFNAANFNQIPH